jgi:hypothetical protein
MFKFLKDAFKKDQPPAEIIPCTGIPDWLDKEEQRLEGELVGETESVRIRISAARERIIDLVDGLSSTEQKEAFHPKLGQVTRSTLPLFEKAMHSACSRNLPEEPEDFYKAATESLKGCIGGMKGQGRHLQGAYPEEMKQIRMAIDEIGREINTLNPVVAEARRKKEAIRQIRSIQEDLIRNHALSIDKEGTGLALRNRVMAVREEMGEVEAELKSIENDPANREIAELKSRIATMTVAKEETARELTALVGVIQHVFGKGEKIAGRKQEMVKAKQIRTAISMLQQYESVSRDDLIGAVGAALPPVTEMIETGDIVLKNKEEKMLFTDPTHLMSHIVNGLERYGRSSRELQDVTQTLDSHPLTRRRKDLEKRVRRLETDLGEADAAARELELRNSTAKSSIPGIITMLEEKIAGYSGRRITIAYNR